MNATSHIDRPTKSPCPACHRETEHFVLFEHSESGREDLSGEGDFLEWQTVYRTLKCCGCGRFTMRTDSEDSRNLDDNGAPVRTVHLYPPKVVRPKPKWLSDVECLFSAPDFVHEFFNEIHTCLDHGCHRAAGLLLRSFLERVMIEQVGDEGCFKKTLEAFCTKGFISTREQAQLQDVIEVGHAATHRDFTPTLDNLNVLLDIVEPLAGKLYVHEKKLRELKASIPRRTK